MKQPSQIPVPRVGTLLPSVGTLLSSQEASGDVNASTEDSSQQTGHDSKTWLRRSLEKVWQLANRVSGVFRKARRRKVPREDYKRTTKIIFEERQELPNGRLRIVDVPKIECTAKFDEDLRNCDPGCVPFNLISYKVVQGLQIPNLEWFTDRDKIPHKIRTSIMRRVEILGQFRAKFWVLDKDCIRKKVFPKPKTIPAHFLVVPEEEMEEDVRISWDVVVNEDMLKPTSVDFDFAAVAPYDPTGRSRRQSEPGGKAIPPRKHDCSKTESEKKENRRHARRQHSRYRGNEHSPHRHFPP